MTIFTQGIYNARELALSRMQYEAITAGATGIVGVHFGVSNHVWGEHATEFLAVGTAIRTTGEGRTTAPAPGLVLDLDD